MRRLFPPRAAGVCAILMMAATLPSAGQSPKPIFGPAGDGGSSRPALDFFLETYQARGQNQSHSSEGGDQAALQERRFYSGLVAGLAYRKNGRRSSFAFNAGDSWRYYSGLGAQNIEQHAGMSFNVRPGRHTSLFAVASALYSPSLQLLAMPGVSGELGAPPIADAALTSDPSLTYGTSLGMSHQIDRQSDLSISGGVQFGRFAAADRNTSAHQIGALYSRRVAGGLALKIGDSVQVLQGASGQAVTAQNVTLGFDYGKALAFSRRTRVGFSTGSSIVSGELGRHYGAIGKAELAHAFSRTWDASFIFDRNLRVVEFMPGPFLANSSILQFQGALGRRLMVRANTAYAFGNIDLDPGLADRYSSVLSEVRLTSPLGRHLQVYGEYLYYEHRFPLGLVLPAGLPHLRVQHGARAGISVWAPLSKVVR